MTQKEPTYLTPRDVSLRLRISINTLGKWRMQKKELKYKKFGKKVLYLLEDIENFEKNGTIKLTKK